MKSGARHVLLMVRALSIGGCERDLTKMALALDRSKYQPHVACFHPDGPRYPELAAARIPVLHLPVKSFASWSAVRGAWTLGRYIRQHDIQVMHAFDVPTDMFGAPVAKLFGVPAIITCQLSYRVPLCTPAERKILRITDWLSDRVVVNSRAVKDDLIATIGLPEKLITVSYNGVDTSTFYRDPESPRMEPVANASLVIGALCALRQEKRIDVLLESFARLRGVRPGTKLLIVGSGDKLSAWRELSDRLGLGDDCIFIPAQQDVVPWLRSMDIFVMTSDSESFPNALLEAMACGCCVIGSRVGGIPELIDDGKNGLLVPAGDIDALTEKLQTVTEDHDLRIQFGKAAQETAHKNFSMDLAARRTEALYDALLPKVA